MRLIDADELKRYIDDCDCCINCPVKKRGCDMDCEMPDGITKAWERVINEQPTPSPWHRVEAELPNVDEKVLVFAVGKLDGFVGDTVIALTSMSDTNWLNHHEKVDKPYWLDPWQYFLTDYRITHWMPLPEPPKEDET